MRGIVKVVIGVVIVLAIVVVTALVLNVLLTSSGSKGSTSSRGTTYTFANLGFAVSYDPSILKVEIDRTLQFPTPATSTSSPGRDHRIARTSQRTPIRSR